MEIVLCICPENNSWSVNHILHICTLVNTPKPFQQQI